MSNNQANQVKAAQLFREAAAGGDPEAQFQYGICLRDGRGVPQNQQEAIEWFRKAANAGYPEASQELSMLQRPPPPAVQISNFTSPPPANPSYTGASAENKKEHPMWGTLAWFIFFCFIISAFVKGCSEGGQ